MSFVLLEGDKCPFSQCLGSHYSFVSAD